MKAEMELWRVGMFSQKGQSKAKSHCDHQYEVPGCWRVVLEGEVI